MHMDWENSHHHIDQLSTLNGKQTKVQKAVEQIQNATDPLIGPDAAKILVAIATEIWSAVEDRNDLRDVKEASSALRAALKSLEAVTSPLDG